MDGSNKVIPNGCVAQSIVEWLQAIQLPSYIENIEIMGKRNRTCRCFGRSECVTGDERSLTMGLTAMCVYRDRTANIRGKPSLVLSTLSGCGIFQAAFRTEAD